VRRWLIKMQKEYSNEINSHQTMATNHSMTQIIDVEVMFIIILNFPFSIIFLFIPNVLPYLVQ
jgi:hypothetical protein